MADFTPHTFKKKNHLRGQKIKNIDLFHHVTAMWKKCNLKNISKLYKSDKRLVFKYPWDK